MTIGAHKKLTAIIEALPARLIEDGANGLKIAKIEDWNLRISWTPGSDRIIVAHLCNQRYLWVGTQANTELDVLQPSVLDAALGDLKNPLPPQVAP